MSKEYLMQAFLSLNRALTYFRSLHLKLGEEFI